MTKRERAPTFVPNDAYSQADWAEVSDNPPLTDAELAAARPGPEGMPAAMAEEFLKRGGRPKAEEKAVPVSLRVPPAVLAAYKAEGPGWQTRMNEALAAGVRPQIATAEVEQPDQEARRAAKTGRSGRSVAASALQKPDGGGFLPKPGLRQITMRRRKPT